MKHTFKKVVVLALTVIMCLSTIVPSAMAAAVTCPGANANHTAYNCTYTESTVAATCEAAGSVVGVCNGCGDQFYIGTVEATGHDWEISAADCDTASYRTCKTCKKVELVKAAAGHAWGDWAVSGGVCRVGEKRVQVCTVCGVENVDIMTEAHSWILDEFVAPVRCGTAGYSVYVCANKGCGAERSEEVWLGDGATAHVWGSWATGVANKFVEGKDPAKVEASCTTAGVETKVCEKCGLTKVVVGSKNTTHTAADIGKRLQFIEGKAETVCGANGTKAYWKCYDCGALYQAVVDGSLIQEKEFGPNDERNPSEADGKFYTKAYYNYKKTEIGASIKASDLASTIAIDTIAHRWAMLGTAKDATCTEAGFVNRTCVFCGTTENSSTPAKGHIFAPDVTSDKVSYIKVVAAANGDPAPSNDANWTVFMRLNPYLKTDVVDATCTTDGSYKWRCLRSGCYGSPTEGKKEVTVPATGHNFSTTVTVAGTIPATCTAPGINKYKCNNANCTVTNDVAVAALGHKLKTTTVAATCEAEGSITEFCERNCGYEPTVTVLPKDPANHAWKYMGTKVDATCTTAGSGTRYCENCQIAPATYEIPALGHKYLTGDDLAKAIKEVNKLGVGQTYGKITYLQAGDCAQIAKYKLTCVNGSCAMFTYHEVSEGFNVGGHDVVVVYRNPANNAMGVDAGTPALNGIVRDIYNVYGDISSGFSGLHGNSGYGQAAAAGHMTDMSRVLKGKNYYWYCKNEGCPMARTAANPTNASEILSEAKGHFVKENGAYRYVALTDVPDERISKLTFDKAKDVKAPVDENGNITAVAIDIPGTTLVWRYVVDACCEYDEVKEGGFWCVECQASYDVKGTGCNVENAAKRGHTLDAGTKVNADCQNYGYVRYSCQNCDYTVVKNYVAPTEHAYVVVKDVKATCLVNGYQYLECRTCNTTEVVVPADAEYQAAGHKNINGEFLFNSCLAVVSGKNNTATNRVCATCATAIISAHSYDANNTCVHCGRTKQN